MFEARRRRVSLEKWIASQTPLPTRKQVQEKFPEVPHKVVRAALQAATAQTRSP